MTKKDLLELRRRFTKECTISRMAGCYVDCNKQMVLKLNENFLNLSEDEFYKFLDIAKKTLSGNVGNNILELAFPADEEEPGGKQQFLRGLRESRLENEDLLDRFYELIIEKLDIAGNYLILVFHDTYDVMTRTQDNIDLDESEEVYDYLLVSICPVELSKPGLGYRADENRIGARLRDWVVGMPQVGFLFPAFNERSADIHKIDFYTKDPKDSHPEFAEDILGCTARRTATEQRMTFGAIVKKAYSGSEEKANEMLLNIQESFNDMVVAQNAENEEEDGAEPLTAPIMLTEDIINEVIEEHKIEANPARIIREVCKQEFADEVPQVEDLVDARAIKANAPVKMERELRREVLELKDELKKERGDAETFDVILKVKPEKTELIRSKVIDDQMYLIIPMSDDEHISINGVEM